MAGKEASAAVEPCCPSNLGPGKVKFAQGIRAGRWVFATGLMAQDFVERHRGGCAGRARAARRPAQAREGSCAHLREPRRGAARRRNRSHQSGSHRPVLHDGQGGAALSAGARARSWRGRIPPSTSIVQQRLLLPGADMNIQALAIIPEKGFEVEHLKHEQLQGPAHVRLFARADGRRFHLHSRHHLVRGRRRAAAQRRRGSRADDARARNGAASRSSSKPSSSSQSAWCSRWRWRARSSRMWCTPRSISPIARTIRPSTRCGRNTSGIGAELFDHPVHRSWARALRRQDRDQRHCGEARQRGEQAPRRRRRRRPRSAISRRR